MAQGYVEPLDKGQNVYHAGEEYFSILLRRCFFQDVETNIYGEVVSCKMHDLMHDIAQEVAGDEICEVFATTSKVNEKARHAYHVNDYCGQSSLPRMKIRTYFRWYMLEPPPMDDIVRNWKYLRALDLDSTCFKELPCAIGRLIHLRYLDLSSNGNLESLPKEITKLHNIQTLLLRDCNMLKELPCDVSNLVNLKVLDIKGCDALTHMPCGLNKLSGLCILPLFVVSEAKSLKLKQGVGRLEDIAALDDLKGNLKIEIRSNVKGNEKGRFLKRKEHIDEIELHWSQNENAENKVVTDKALADELQPNPNLKGLRVSGYSDVEKPSWAIDDKLQTALPNLLHLGFDDCKGLKDLPMLGRLQFLKTLQVKKMANLEYMENGSRFSYGGDEASTGTGFFPSLEVLQLWDLPKLKGWWRGDRHMDDDKRSHMSISFPRLSNLWIQNCPLLTSVPLCPIEILVLYDFNERLEIMKKEIKSGDKLREVYTDDVGYLKSLPMPTAFKSLSMFITGDEKVVSLREVEDVFRSCSSSLQHLYIRDCENLRSVSGALDHLTALQTLKLRIDDDFIEDEKIRCRLEDEDEVQWSALHSCLLELDINYMPTGIRHLTSLHTLKLQDVYHVRTIPDWFTCLCSLRSLKLYVCSHELTRRCKRPHGPDWPKIQHIPDITFHMGDP